MGVLYMQIRDTMNLLNKEYFYKITVQFHTSIREALSEHANFSLAGRSSIYYKLAKQREVA